MLVKLIGKSVLLYNPAKFSVNIRKRPIALCGWYFGVSQLRSYSSVIKYILHIYLGKFL